jgi:hypothetical protein
MRSCPPSPCYRGPLRPPPRSSGAQPCPAGHVPASSPGVAVVPEPGVLGAGLPQPLDPIKIPSLWSARAEPAAAEDPESGEPRSLAPFPRILQGRAGGQYLPGRRRNSHPLWWHAPRHARSSLRYSGSERTSPSAGTPRRTSSPHDP